jgi:hypothetical protein
MLIFAPYAQKDVKKLYATVTMSEGKKTRLACFLYYCPSIRKMHEMPVYTFYETQIKSRRQA